MSSELDCSSSDKATQWYKFVAACDEKAAKHGIESELIQKATRQKLNEMNVAANRREGRTGSPSAKVERRD